MHDFEPYSALHLITVIACFGVMAAMAFFGRQWRRAAAQRERIMRIAWVAALVFVAVFAMIWWLLPAQFQISVSLPLHICDLVIVAAPFALLLKVHWLRSLVYFWGIALSIHAFIMPVLRQGPDDVVFWVFWIMHTQIVGSAVYLVAVLDYRPTWRDLVFVIAVTVAYTALVTPLNVELNVDYGYVGPGDGPAAVLGPWPARMLVMLALESIGFALLWLPWAIHRSIGAKLSEEAASPRRHGGAEKKD